jgi:putative membrane protein
MKPTAFAATLALTLPLLATTSVSALAVSTEEFVNKVAVSDMFEVKSGKLAAKKAAHEDVKDFGEQMVEDHTETTEDLKELVKDENIKVEMPKSLDEKHQANLDKLKDISGEKFDRVYVPMQVLAHEQAVNLFEDYSKSGDNEALKEWAADTVPTLKEHLEEVRELNTELSKPAKTAAAETGDKAMNKKSMEEVTEETDVDGTDKTATTEKAGDKAMTADDEKAKAEMAEDRKPAPPSFNYVTEQSASDWTAQALIGRSVQNENGETLGEVNNVILNEKGKVVAVTIGVGGFLGLGEKDVGVPFDALKFRDEDAMEKKADNDDADDVDETASAEDAEEAHDDMVIVIDATKEQLEAAPSFVWLGEKREKRADADTGNDTAVE